MTAPYEIDTMDALIKDLRQAAERLLDIGQEIEAVKRNVDRILSSLKMLELNISDVREFVSRGSNSPHPQGTHH